MSSIEPCKVLTNESERYEEMMKIVIEKCRQKQKNLKNLPQRETVPPTKSETDPKSRIDLLRQQPAIFALVNSPHLLNQHGTKMRRAEDLIESFSNTKIVDNLGRRSTVMDTLEMRKRIEKLVQNDIMSSCKEIMENQEEGFPKMKSVDGLTTELCWKIGYKEVAQSQFLRIVVFKKKTELKKFTYREILNVEIIDYHTYSEMYDDGSEKNYRHGASNDWNNCSFLTLDDICELLVQRKGQCRSSSRGSEPMSPTSSINKESLLSELEYLLSSEDEEEMIVYWWLPRPEKILPGFQFLNDSYPIVLSTDVPSVDAIQITWAYDPKEKIDFEKMTTQALRDKWLLYGDDGTTIYDSDSEFI